MLGLHTHTHAHTHPHTLVLDTLWSDSADLGLPFFFLFRHQCDKLLSNQILLRLFQRDPFFPPPPPPNRLDPNWVCSRRLYSTLCPITVQCRLLCKTLKAVISCIPRFTRWVSHGSTFGAATVSGFFVTEGYSPAWWDRAALSNRPLLCQNCSMILFFHQFCSCFYHYFVVVVVLKTMLNLRPLHTENACNESEQFFKDFNDSIWLVFMC